jgi:beta-galactosidase
MHLNISTSCRFLHLFVAILGFWVISYATAANEPRVIIPLNDGWGIKPITHNSRDAELTPVTLPHTWNANYLEGTTQYNREMMVYQRPLVVTGEMQGKRLFLYFEGVNSAADVFVNHRTVGQHLGGYTAFCLEITEAVHLGENLLEVWVSNAYRTDILPISGDFNIYGGIHRPCHLLITEPDCISPLFYASPGVFIRQQSVSAEQAKLTIESHFSIKEPRAGLQVKTVLNDAQGNPVATVTSALQGETIEQTMSVDHPHLWDGKKNPYLYTATVELYEGGRLLDRVTQRTGLRSFKVDSEKGFFLNGHYLNLYGFCRHEDVKGRGSALLLADYERDMEIIQEAGATVMRLAHYPHGEPIYDLCDENGVLLWTEIPMCGPGGYAYTGFLNNEGFKENARQVTRELVYQKFNHPSICFWGIFNELLISDGKRFQEYDHPVAFVQEINALYKSIDPSRLTTFATCVDQSNYLDCADLTAWNKYFNWRVSEQMAGDFFDEAHREAGQHPVGVSEYGAGASIQHHASVADSLKQFPKGYHPEEYQALCHEGYWAAFAKRPYLWAKIIWQFSDMQSSIRHEGDTEGINDKGMVTYDRSTKKDIFYFYKANWNPEPMLYLCSRRFTERSEAAVEVKAYTTLSEVTLYVNGKRVGKARRDDLHRVRWENVPLEVGENTVRVEGRSGKETFQDQCTVTRK